MSSGAKVQGGPKGRAARPFYKLAYKGKVHSGMPQLKLAFEGLKDRVCSIFSLRTEASLLRMMLKRLGSISIFHVKHLLQSR